MIVIYFVATVVGFYASSHFAFLSVGASAGIFGLIGAMIAFGITERSALGSAVKAFYVRWAIFGLVLSFLPHVDIAAHIGGLAAGFGVGYVAGSTRLMLRAESLWRAAAGFAIAITALAFAAMVLWMVRVNQG